MAEEETTIRRITLRPYNIISAVDEVIRMLRDLTPADRIHLILYFYDFRFTETVELRELILGMKHNIDVLEVLNGWNERYQYLLYFNFFVRYLETNNGETTHFIYFTRYDITSPCFDINVPQMQLEQATELSNAIRSNNNNRNIKSFDFSGRCDNREVFQRVWDDLLTIGVQDINLNLEFSKNNNQDKNDSNNLDFSNISTNTSLNKLQLKFTLYGTNLFDSIKGNTTVEKFIVSSRYGDADLLLREQRAFIDLLVENTTLIHVELTDGHYNPILREEINIHTTLNQIWNRLGIAKQKERMAAATTTAAASISTTTTNVAITVVAVDNATVERRREQDHNIHEVEKMKKMEEEKKMMKKKKRNEFMAEDIREKAFHM